MRMKGQSITPRQQNEEAQNRSSHRERSTAVQGRETDEPRRRLGSVEPAGFIRFSPPHRGGNTADYEEEVFDFSETDCPRSALMRSTSFRGLNGLVM